MLIPRINLRNLWFVNYFLLIVNISIIIYFKAAGDIQRELATGLLKMVDVIYIVDNSIEFVIPLVKWPVIFTRPLPPAMLDVLIRCCGEIHIKNSCRDWCAIALQAFAKGNSKFFICSYSIIGTQYQFIF